MENHKLGAGVDLIVKTDFVPDNSLYNIWGGLSNDHVYYNVYVSNDIKDAVTFCGFWE